MSLWIGYNDQKRTGDLASVIVEAESKLFAEELVHIALLDYSVKLFPGCWGQRRRFAILDWVEPYDGPAPEEFPYVVLGP